MAAMSDYVVTGATADELWPLVRDFHYSRKMPSAIRHCFAVRKPGGLFGDTGEAIAGAIYGNPCNRNWEQTAVELLRLVRRDDAEITLSQALGWSLRWLRASTETPFALSYADTDQGHHGGIYQATNWRYIGQSKPRFDGLVHPLTGEFIHGRQVGRMFGTQRREVLEQVRGEYELAHHGPKNVYIYPLRTKWKHLQAQYGWIELPYPKPDLETGGLT